jgi:HSP20 family protein
MANQPEKGKQKEQQAGGNQQSTTGGSAPVPYRRGAMMPTGQFEPFYRFRDEFNRLFENLMPGWMSPWEGFGQRDRWGLDVREDEGNVVVRAEAPGFEPNDFDLEVRGDQLVLHAAHKAESEEKERGYREWRQQEFYRAVPLPGGIATDKVAANYRNGVLTVTLPRTEESKGRHITVQG